MNLSHVNVQGLLSKLDDIDIFMNNFEIDILCISEHWISKNDPSNITFPYHRIVTYFSRQTHIHGGSLIIASNKLNTKMIASINNLSVECHIEICAICCTIGELKYIVVVAYRPPCGNIDEFIINLNQALNIASSMSCNIILCGDFNIDAMQKCHNTNVLFDVFSSFQLDTTSVIVPTRIFTNIHGHTSSSCIDYMVSNIPISNLSSKLYNPNIADHFAHILNINITKAEKDTPSLINFKRRSLNENNIKNLISEMNKHDWTNIYSANVNDAFNFFTDTIIWCYNITCPIKSVIKRNSINNNNLKKEWLTNEIIRQSDYIKNLYWLMINTNSGELKIIYNEQKTIYKNSIKTTKQNFYKNKINNASNKTKKTWDIINTRLGRKNKINNCITLYDNKNEKISDNLNIVNIFANHFSTDIQNKMEHHFGSNLSLPCTVSPYREHSIYFAPITLEEINEAIINLKNKPSTGFDGITANMLKIVKDNILHQLVYLFNLSINQGCFPDTLKLAKVVPILKNGSPEEVENYRQISVLSEISKLFERIVYNRIISFSSKYNILTAFQHGFTAGKSTESAIYHLLNYVYTCLDNGKYVVSIMFDLSKAFDTVNKYFLEQKLYSMGIRGNLLSWINSYMEGRTLKVQLNNFQSEMQTLMYGVPQGSVLGPLLFMLYVNNLPNYLTAGHLTMFADDITVTLSADTVEQLHLLIEQTFEEISTWAQRDKLIMNKNKTAIINFSLQRQLPHGMVLHDSIILSHNTKLLGTHLDNKLLWDKHIEHVCAQLNKAYFAILQMQSTLDEAGLLSIYYALAYSHISYNIIAWGSARDRDRVFVCQKRLIRLIFQMNYNESCKYIFKTKKILTTPCIFIFKCLMYTKKNMDLFTQRNNCHSYSTRCGIYLVYPDIIHQTINTRRTIIVFYFLIVFQLTFEIYKIIETIKQQLEIYC